MFQGFWNRCTYTLFLQDAATQNSYDVAGTGGPAILAGKRGCREGACALEAVPQALHPCPPLCMLTRTHAHSHARRLILTWRTHAAPRQDDDEMEEEGDEDPSGKVPWAVLARGGAGSCFTTATVVRNEGGCAAL